MQSIIQSDSVLREYQGADNSHSKHVRRQVSEIFSVETCFETMAAPVSEEGFRTFTNVKVLTNSVTSKYVHIIIKCIKLLALVHGCKSRI